MSGLLYKDMRLLVQRKQTLVLFVIIMIVMGFSMGTSVLIGYGTALFGILAMTTLAYDDLENCMAFLLTLPITAKEYVKEKFVFCGGGLLVGWVISIVISAAFAAGSMDLGEFIDTIPENIAILLVFAAAASINIPVQLKFGAEKSRLVLILMVGAVAALGYAMWKLAPAAESVEFLNSLSDGVILLGFLIPAVIIIAISYRTAIKVLKNKAF